jgi:competence protein ComEC
MRSLRVAVLVAAAWSAAVFTAQVSAPLEIYWIDVEGGASTLIVTPQRQSILMDAGWAGFEDRDARRIEHVVKHEAGLSRIDFALVSHFHADHAGGLSALSRLVPIGAFYDHGQTVETTPAARALFDQYVSLAGDRRRVAKPGDKLPLTGVDLTIVAAHSQVLAAPLPGGGPNPLCGTFKPQATDAGENGKSLGYVMRAGRFAFANLGDLSWNFQHPLACPVNLLGQVDIFQVTHHGVRDDVLPQQMWAMAPTVAVMNNGHAKGAGAEGVETVLSSPGIQDLWSLHRLTANDVAHNAREWLTANLGETDGCQGAWIRARVRTDGTYTLFNSRNGFAKTYRIRTTS